MSAMGMKGGHIFAILQPDHTWYNSAKLRLGLIAKGKNAQNSFNNAFNGCLNLEDNLLLCDKEKIF